MLCIFSDELYHHGIKGQKWGIRRYQNPDGTYTEAGLKRLHKKDVRWAKRNYNKLYKKTYRKSKREFNRYLRKDLNKRLSREAKGGIRSRRYMNAYNKKLAEIMNKNAADLRSPYTNQAVKFIAKRGELGVHLALAGDGFDMETVRNGVYGSGKVAYRKDSVNIER
jgi:hypothetical protein